MNNTTVNYANLSTLSKLSSTEAITAGKQVSVSAINDKVGASVQTDQTSLSLAGGLITKAIAGASTDVRTEKVASLQKAIASGTYNVSSTDVAAKLLTALLR